MEYWYMLNLSDGIMAAAPAEEIKERFLLSFHAAGDPVDMAVFTRYDSEGRLQCDVIAYFSPAAREVAEAFDAEPCAKPLRTGLGLLAGDERAWSALFGEAGQ